MGNGQKLKEMLKLNINSELLDKSLEHSSYINTKKISNIDDAKIESHIGRELTKICYYTYHLINSDEKIDNISKNFNAIIIAERISDLYAIGPLIYLSKGERQNDKKYYPDVIYRVLFIIYKELGLNGLYDFMINVWSGYVGRIDYRSQLNEYLDVLKEKHEYEFIGEDGPANAKIFTVKLFARNKEYIATDKSKKLAIAKAAKMFFDMNNIVYKNKLKLQRKSLRFDKMSRITPGRKSEILEFRKIINIGDFHISDELINCTLTHKSYVNEKEMYDNSELISLGSSVLNLYLSIYLYNNNVENYAEMVSKIGQLVKSENLEEVTRIKYEQVFKYIRVVNGMDLSKVYSADIYKAVLASLIINYFITPKAKFESTEKIIESNIKNIYSNKINEDNFNYGNWFNSFICIMELDFNFNLVNEYGNSNDKNYEFRLRVELSQYGIENYVGKAIGRRKKDLRVQLSKKFYKYLEEKYNFNEYINYEGEAQSIFIKDLISFTMNQNAFYTQNIKLLGGLCLNNWNYKNAKNIIENLKYRGLDSEIAMIYPKWIKLYRNKISEINDIYKNKDLYYLVSGINMEYENNDIEVVYNRVDDEIIFKDMCRDKENNYLEDSDLNEENERENISIAADKNKKKMQEEIMVNIENRVNKLVDKKLDNSNHIKGDLENIGYKIKIEKDVVIFTKVYFFGGDNCHYCSGDLDDVNTLIHAEYNNDFLILDMKIKSCSICGIRGVDEKINQEISDLGFSINYYLGSPAYYSSAIIIRKRAEVACLLDEKKKKKKKKKKIISLEMLEKQLLIKNDIGKKGEEFVLEYEKNNLISLDRSDLANKVKMISELDCTAGFDILSYFDDGSEKYIEVKSTTGNLNNFYLTINEFKVARELKESYYIYKVNNLYINPYIRKVVNPAEKIESGELILKPSQYYVTMK